MYNSIWYMTALTAMSVTLCSALENNKGTLYFPTNLLRLFFPSTIQFSMRYFTLCLFLCARGALSHGQLTCTSTTCPAKYLLSQIFRCISVIIHFLVPPVSSLGYDALVVFFPLHVFLHASVVPVSFDLHYFINISFSSLLFFSTLPRSSGFLLPYVISSSFYGPSTKKLMLAEGYQCTQDQLSAQVNCGPLQSTPSSQSISPSSAGSSVTTPSTVTSVTTDTASVTTTTPPLSGSTSTSSSSSDSSTSTSTQLAVPSASPGQNYTITSDDPSISYNGTNGPSSSDAWIRGSAQDLPTIPSCADVGAVHSTTQVNASLTFPFVGMFIIFHSFSIA